MVKPTGGAFQHSHEDTYKHKGLREKLIKELKEKGITDELVLEAMLRVPRHFFLDSAFSHIAYEDRAFSIGEEQTISQPYTVAYQTQLLGVKPKDKVFEVGTGSMYQSVILAELGAMVFTVERIKALYDRQKFNPLRNKYPMIKTFLGDGFEGLPTYAPFDRIIITAGAPYVPEQLLKQLKPGGVMVVPVTEDENVQRMMRITKLDAETYNEETFDAFSFVPMLRGVHKH
jgi:protein-L-isoaspartate(D-aspartate) O-methyltransferase